MFYFGFSVETPDSPMLGHLQVQARFGDEHRIHLDSIGESFLMVELYVHLFQGLEHNADVEQWRLKTQSSTAPYMRNC